MLVAGGKVIENANIICEYDDFWVAYDTDREKIFLYNHYSEECELEEVFRLEFSEYKDKNIDEILEMCPCEYNYSGELDDCSAYVFWKEISWRELEC